MDIRACELCNSEARVFCPSDSAFLCWNCDSKVHGANFLVARHVRHAVCCKCNGFLSTGFYGVRVRPIRPLCRPCSPVCFSGDELDSSSSSDCISSTESCVTPQKKAGFNSLNSGGGAAVSSTTGPEFSGEVSSLQEEKRGRSRAPMIAHSKARDALMRWCTELGTTSGVGAMAFRALRVCTDEMAVTPIRASLAASLWFGLRMCGEGSGSTTLRRLEEISGVPCKVILMAELKIKRVLNIKMKMRRNHNQHQQKQEQVEGWAEC